MKTNNDILEKLKKDVIKAKEIIEKEECFHFKYLEKDPAVDCNEYFIKLFIITNKNLGYKIVSLSFEKRDNELLHSFLTITKDIIISAEKFIMGK